MAMLRAWAKKQEWRLPRFGFESAFLARMLESDAGFSLAVQDAGVGLRLPVERHAVTPAELEALDALYAARNEDGRPSSWGELVEELRDLRRAVEAGVKVEVDGHTLRTWQGFYTWAHGRYHMLEDGYDSWIGDDRS
jgi:hypothetical protein